VDFFVVNDSVFLNNLRKANQQSKEIHHWEFEIKPSAHFQVVTSVELCTICKFRPDANAGLVQQAGRKRKVVARLCRGFMGPVIAVFSASLIIHAVKWHTECVAMLKIRGFKKASGL